MKVFKYMVLFCLLSPFVVLAGEEGKAKVITGFNDAANCIAPVRVTRIDDREATVQPMGFDLEPGIHTMKGSVVIDESFCSSVGNSSRYQIEPIEAEFEAGKTYYLGYDHKSAQQKEWKLVIWKVEDSKD